MASPPNRSDLADTPTVATYKLAIGALYDYVASLLGNGTATIASETEKKLARENLGVGSFGFKNRLINPEFLISQEFGNASTPIVAGAAIKYVVDQWYATCTGANISARQIAGIEENQYSLRLIGASSNTSFMLGQRIESANCYDLRNKSVTVSLNAKSTSARTITWTAYYANVYDTFTTKTSIATGTIDVAINTGKHQFTFNAGANAGNGIAIEFSGGALLAGSTIEFDSLQLEQSAVATEFEKRSIQSETLLCLRYYEAGARREKYLGGYGNVIISKFLVEKRAAPLVGIFNGSTSNAINVSGSNVTISSLSIYSTDYAFNTTAVGLADSQYVANWTLFANARL